MSPVTLSRKRNTVNGHISGVGTMLEQGSCTDGATQLLGWPPSCSETPLAWQAIGMLEDKAEIDIKQLFVDGRSPRQGPDPLSTCCYTNVPRRPQAPDPTAADRAHPAYSKAVSFQKQKLKTNCPVHKTKGRILGWNGLVLPNE